MARQVQKGEVMNEEMNLSELLKELAKKIKQEKYLRF